MYCFAGNLGAAIMPKNEKPPAYRLQKARNCAVVTIDGKDHYLGPYGSGDSYEKYARLIAQWKATGPARPVLGAGSGESLKVAELTIRYWD